MRCKGSEVSKVNIKHVLLNANINMTDSKSANLKAI